MESISHEEDVLRKKLLDLEKKEEGDFEPVSLKKEKSEKKPEERAILRVEKTDRELPKDKGDFSKILREIPGEKEETKKRKKKPEDKLSKVFEEIKEPVKPKVKKKSFLPPPPPPPPAGLKKEKGRLLEKDGDKKDTKEKEKKPELREEREKDKERKVVKKEVKPVVKPVVEKIEKPVAKPIVKKEVKKVVKEEEEKGRLLEKDGDKKDTKKKKVIKKTKIKIPKIAKGVWEKVGKDIKKPVKKVVKKKKSVVKKKIEKPVKKPVVVKRKVKKKGRLLKKDGDKKVKKKGRLLKKDGGKKDTKVKKVSLKIPKKVKRKSSRKILNKAHIKNVMKILEEDENKYREELRKTPLDQLKHELSKEDFKKALRIHKSGFRKSKRLSKLNLRDRYLRKLKEIPLARLVKILPKSDYKRALKIHRGIVEKYVIKDYLKRKKIPEVKVKKVEKKVKKPKEKKKKKEEKKKVKKKKRKKLVKKPLEKPAKIVKPDVIVVQTPGVGGIPGKGVVREVGKAGKEKVSKKVVKKPLEAEKSEEVVVSTSEIGKPPKPKKVRRAGRVGKIKPSKEIVGVGGGKGTVLKGPKFKLINLFVPKSIGKSGMERSLEERWGVKSKGSEEQKKAEGDFRKIYQMQSYDKRPSKEEMQRCAEDLQRIKLEMSKILIGQEEIVNGLIMGLLCNAHVLVEGVPGIAKTLAIKALATVSGCSVKRIQFTVDMLPTDIIGITTYTPQKGFEVLKGPIFANFLIADEINRSPPKTQSALIEGMQERQVTIGRQRFDLPSPFFVMATENPIESAGVYPLPEAQIDRFLFKVLMGYPRAEVEKIVMESNISLQKFEEFDLKAVVTPERIVEMQGIVKRIYLDESIKNYILSIVRKTRTKDFPNAEYITYGSSPRASIGLFIASKARALIEGRNYVLPEDIKSVAYAILRHRLILSYKATIQKIDEDFIIKDILDSIKVD